MTLYITVNLFNFMLCIMAAYGGIRMAQDVWAARRRRPELPEASNVDTSDFDLALAERGITVEEDERSFTAVTVDGVRISGPELTFELPAKTE